MRTCGDCKACCWAPEIPAIKQVAEWCPNCDPHAKLGCRIYEDRPTQCSQFECLYIRQPQLVPSQLAPRKSGVMLTSEDGKTMIVWEVRKGAARSKVVSNFLRMMKGIGIRVLIADPRTRETVIA